MQVTRTVLNELFVALEMPMAAKWTEKRLMDKINKLPDVVDEDTDAGDHQQVLDDLLEAVEAEEEIEIEAEEAKPKKQTAAQKKKAAAAKKKAAAAKAKAAAEEEDEEEEDEEYEDAEEEDAEEEEEPKPKKQTAAQKKKAAAAKKKAAAAKAAAEEEDDDEEEEEEEPKKKPAKSKKKPAVKKKKAGPGVIASIVEYLTKANSKRPISKDAICEKLAERFPEREAESMMRTINVQVPNRLKSDKGLEVKKNDKGYWIDG